MTISIRTASLRSSTAFAVALAGMGSAVSAEEITVVSGSVGNAVAQFAEIVKPWEERTGHTATMVPMPASTTDQFGQYRLWLAAGNGDIDLYQTDVIWAPQLSEHFVDLTEAASDVIGDHFPAIIESQTVDGKLVALPLYTDAPALYYRTDLLEKHGFSEPPATWDELTEMAQTIQEAERAEGNSELWGFVWQGNAYEGLTCDALEWVKSHGGGQIVEADGTISINNENAIEAIEQAASWVGTISPPGVVSYQEEESRGVWQTGNAVFMRNWPYAYALSESEDSAVAGNFAVTTLPSGGEGSAATLGGWNIAVSQYGDNIDIATDLALYLASEEAQKMRAIETTNLPTIQSLYSDPEIAEQVPIIPRWEEVFLNAVPRPSAPTREDYNEVSTLFFSAVHSVLTGEEDAATALEDLEFDLEDVLE